VTSQHVKRNAFESRAIFRLTSGLVYALKRAICVEILYYISFSVYTFSINQYQHGLSNGEIRFNVRPLFKTVRFYEKSAFFSLRALEWEKKIL